MRSNLAKAVLKRREQVLIVDDDADTCELLGLVLREAGYSIDLARSGSEALAKAARRRPDVVLADVQMPGIDGIELARRLHTADASVPVVLTTGTKETRDLVTSAARYGAICCLTKPMNLDELLWTIESAMTSSRQRAGRRPIVD
jgi:DNA-binding response OmpR family regulator